MKGFKNSTRTQKGFDFTRTSTPVKPHTRAMPMKKAKGGRVACGGSRHDTPLIGN